MSNPTASATTNKTNYAPGETIVLTINHTDADRTTMTISGVVTDSTGGTGNWSTTFTIDAGNVTFTQTGGKTWTLQSATRDQSVFTATA